MVDGGQLRCSTCGHLQRSHTKPDGGKCNQCDCKKFVVRPSRRDNRGHKMSRYW